LGRKKKGKTKIVIEGAKLRKPKKPRGLGSGFHKDKREKRINNTPEVEE